MFRFTPWTLVSFLSFSVLLILSPVPANAASSGAFAFSDAGSIGCTHGAYRLNAVTIFSEPGYYTVHTFADIGTTRYMDFFTPLYPPLGGGVRPWGLYNFNTGGTATGTWPLPEGPDILVTAQLIDPVGIPIWESRITIGSCTSLTVMNPTSGAIEQLMGNYGFEQAGDSEAIATQWVTTAGDDRRVCNKNTVIVAKFGECAYRFKGAGTLRQTYKTRPFAVGGDQMRLSAYVKGTKVAAGSTIKAVIRTANAPSRTITLTVPSGDFDYHQLNGLPVNIALSPNQVTVTVKKVGGGTLWVDQVMLLSVANAGAQIALSPLSLPEAAP